MDLKLTKNHYATDDGPGPLDNTCIHPEDYELACKMSTDALELDEEDVHGEHPSHGAIQKMSPWTNVLFMKDLSVSTTPRPRCSMHPVTRVACIANTYFVPLCGGTKTPVMTVFVVTNPHVEGMLGLDVTRVLFFFFLFHSST